MKRKLIFSAIIIFILSAFFLDTYLRIETDLGLVARIQRSDELTEEEREWLDEHGTIIYGADQNAPPLRYLDEDSGQFKGMVIDYVRALSIELGIEIEFIPYVWEEALLKLEKGETDICDMYPSDKRAEVYLFTDAIYNQKSIILTQVDEQGINSYEDLEGKNVAAQKGDYAADFLVENLDTVNFEFTDDYGESIRLLTEGKVDAIVGDEPVISYFVEEMNLKDALRVVGQPLFETESVLAVPKSEEMLQNILNKGIRNLKRKDTMENIYQKWYGISAPFIKENTMEKVLLAGVAVATIITVLVYLFISWNRLLSKEVDKRTSELNVSKKDLQTTFDSLMHLMIVLDSERQVINVNKSVCRLLEKDRDDLIGRPLVDMMPFAYEGAIKNIIDQTLVDGQSYHEEVTIDDRLFEISTYQMEDDEAQVSRILVMARDITKMRISEQKLLQSNKIAAVGQLAAGVAHEVRNPLGLIRTYCYILKNSMIDDQARKDKAIEVIESSVEKASTIIDNLLNFSRLTGDEIDRVNMRTFMENILNLEHKLMTRNNIEAHLECDEDLVCEVNQESLKHIFLNLISNAVDAMPDGGTLEIMCQLSDDNLEIICRDTGVGIEEKDLENIFNPFFTTKAPGEGTGLGLYLTYNEVQKLNGDIQIESKPGEGTQFTIVLPLQRGNGNGA